MKLNKDQAFIFYGTVFIALFVIVYFITHPNNKNEGVDLSTGQITENSPSPAPSVTEVPKVSLQATNTPTPTTQNAVSSPSPSKVPSKTTSTPKENTNTTQNAIPETPKQNNPTLIPQKSPSPVAGLTIPKSAITSTAKFYPYKVNNIPMEVIAVKADDGTIRTALNTCQVCYDSGKGYYEQVGQFLACQNCKNKFSINQIEVVKGGCNPVPVLAENKTETADAIFISGTFLESHVNLFKYWKK